MTPSEIAALLALPEAIRARLAECPGPGWLCSTEWVDRSRIDMSGRRKPETRPATATLHKSCERTYDTTGDIGGGDVLDSVRAMGRPVAWCPVDTAALLEVAHALGAVRPEVMRRVGGGWRASAENYEPEPIARDADAPATARLAALRLLASLEPR